MTKPIMERFLSKVSKEPNGCWIWTASVDSSGGRFSMGRKKAIKAHRMSWELYKGKIPPGKTIRQKCKCILCVNPDHLEMHGSSKITDKMLHEMKYMRLGGSTYGEIGKKFGYTATHVANVLTGRYKLKGK